jgi:hypothetical protein
MNQEDVRTHIEELIAQKNYVAAFEHLRRSVDDEALKIDLTGAIANALVDELDAARGKSPERLAYLRAQLAWVSREVPGLSGMYREQLRGQRLGLGSEVWGALRDIAEGRPEEAIDRAKQGVEDLREELRSPDSTEKVENFFKQAEKNIRGGIEQAGSFFEDMVRRGASIREDRDAKNDGPDHSIEIKIETEKDKD